MPELPEAETIVRGLRRTVVGERIRRIDIPRPDVLPQTPRAFRRAVGPGVIAGVGRRAKNVLVRLDGGALIVVNLGMTGRLLPFPTPPRGPRRPTHPAVVWRFESGGVLFFDDVRRFGRVECLEAEAWEERSARIGPEPLSRSFTARRLHGDLSTSRSPLRSWLLDQRRVAGVGNIYANEALFLAGLHPRSPASSVDLEGAERLRDSIREVLQSAIDAGGTTLRDYRDADGQEGQFASRLYVYGRDEEPCLTCGAEIERIVFGGRSAFACPSCQPLAE